MKKEAECIILPDIHGRDFWKRVFSDDCKWVTDNYVFLGDYFDPYPSEGITVDKAIINWHELMNAINEWKASHPEDNFFFLMGNHDAHYISRVFNAISGGCRQSTNPEIPRLLTSMRLNIACELRIANRHVLFSHAGVMAKWYHAHEELIGELSAQHLNELCNTDEGWRALADCDFYRGGLYDYGSPLWADIRLRKEHENELQDFGYDYQIVGHTQIRSGKPIIMDAIADIDCHKPFALTNDFKLNTI